MNDRLSDHFFIKKSDEYKQISSSPLTEFADSGIVSRITPLSSINDNKLNTNLFVNNNDDDDESITTENQYLSFNLTEISKRMVFFQKRNFSM
jgi:hypothetical protein